MGPHCKTHIESLEKVHKRATRFTTNNYTKTPGITTHLKQQINMDPLTLRRQAHRLTMLYKITNNQIDINKHEYLDHANTYRTRNTHNHKYHTLSASSDAYKHSFFPKTIIDWNSLPEHIVNANTPDTFKKLTLTHLRSQP